MISVCVQCCVDIGRRMGNRRDVESGSGNGNLSEPLVNRSTPEKGGLCMVLFSTFIAVCGAFEFGSCVSIEST